MLRIAVLVLLIALGGCRQNSVKPVEPELGASSPTLDFGVVKLGTPASLVVELSARTQAAVDIAASSLEGDGFSVGEVPQRLDGLATAPVTLTFTPRTEGAVTGRLVLRSSDAQRPELVLALRGVGASASVELELGCDAAAGCGAQVRAAPPGLDFGEEPLLRRLPLEVAQLPFVRLRATGPVPVRLSGFTLSGPAAASYAFATGAPADQDLAPGATLRVPLRFVPNAQSAAPFEAAVALRTDAPAASTLTIALTGRARPNLPPTVCINLTEVVPPGGAPALTFQHESDWAPLRAPGPAGADFTLTRPVPPRAVVTLSAHAPGGPRDCTSDPEDGRLLLSYEWALVSSPGSAPAPTLAGAGGPTLRLAPVATGDYLVRLTVRDAQGTPTSTTARFRVEVRNELVVQVAWGAPDGGTTGVDLDLHLVRPGGAPFGVRVADGGAVTSDDVSGFTVSGALLDAGLSVDWGLPGPGDDPRLNVDDSGDGALVENVSLDGPANGCLTGPCRYGVYVHAFRDGRALPSAPVCTVAGCLEGEACGCAAGTRCVADAAPRDAGATGQGRCRPEVNVEVRVFVLGAPVASFPLPALAPPDVVGLSAPCHLLHVADLDWPLQGSDAGVVVRGVGVDGAGRFVTPSLSRFGWRPPGPSASLSCSPNTRVSLPSGSTPWFSEEPR